MLAQPIVHPDYAPQRREVHVDYASDDEIAQEAAPQSVRQDEAQRIAEFQAIRERVARNEVPNDVRAQ